MALRFEQFLFQKTESLIPQQNSDLQNKLQESLKIINKDTEKFVKSNITESSLQTFISQIDQKLTSSLFNTQQQITQNMSNQEQRLDQKITDIQEKTNSQNTTSLSLNTQVSDLLKKLENSSAKGKMSENILVNILHSLYPSGQIDHVGQTKETGDVILSRKDKPKILIENKDWGKNVVQEEVKKFIHDIETQNCSGLFLSQNYGIANKENFEINLHDGNVLIYVHEANNDPDKIKIAIVGVGNCANSLYQGLTFYSGYTQGKERGGLMKDRIGGYSVSDIEVVAAFDVDKRKVGVCFREAMWAKPNCTLKFEPNVPDGPLVQMGPVFDGNYAATCDSRFNKAIEEMLGHRFYGAIPIHDRFDTWEAYDYLSR